MFYILNREATLYNFRSAGGVRAAFSQLLREKNSGEKKHLKIPKEFFINRKTTKEEIKTKKKVIT